MWFCIESEIPHNGETHQHEICEQNCKINATHNKDKHFEKCKPVTDEIDNDYDEIGSDNNDVEMKAQKLHPPQRRNVSKMMSFEQVL